MNFKVGDRVRLVAQDEGSIVRYGDIRGTEGVIVDFCPAYSWTDCHVQFDGRGKPWNCAFRQLAPLTPPQADEWAQSKVRDLFKPTYLEPEKEREFTLDEINKAVRKHLGRL